MYLQKKKEVIQMSSYFSCLLIGDWGSGKTTAASTAPGPVLFLDTDNKLHKMVNLKPAVESDKLIQWALEVPLSTLGLRRLATTDMKPGTKLAVQRPLGYMNLVTMIEELVTSKCIITHQGKKIKIETVVLDSYTTMDEHIRRLLMAVNGTTTMTLPLYGALLSNFEEINNTLLRLPSNVIFICHEKADKDELTGKITFKPMISGGMAFKIGKDFEEVYYMQKTIKGDKAIYEMNTVGDSMRSCRTSRVLSKMVEANFSKIYRS